MNYSHLIKSSLAGTIAVQYNIRHPLIFLRMDQPLMFFSTKKIIQIKNALLDTIRELREFRSDWKTFKCSSLKKMSVKISYANLDYPPEALLKPIELYKGLPYYINLNPEQANTFVRDIKDVIVEMQLFVRQKK